MTDPETPTSSRRRGALIAGSVAFVVLVAGGVWFAQQPPGANARSGPVPDFAAIEDVQTKKDTFFGFLAPMIAERNEWVLKQRAFLRNLRDRLDAAAAARCVAEDPALTEREAGGEVRTGADDGRTVACHFRPEQR